MTLCRKCGKEIPDGQELCEECQNENAELDEAYLDELIQNMDLAVDHEENPEDAVPETLSFDEALDEEILEDEPVTPESETEEEPLPEIVWGENSDEETTDILSDDILSGDALSDDTLSDDELLADDILADALPSEEELEFALDETADTSDAAGEALAVSEETVAEEESEQASEDDINHLLDMLSDDYEESEAQVEETALEEEDAGLEEAAPSLEASLFDDNEEADSFFADSIDELDEPESSSGATMDDVFQDALSAVGYSEKEGEDEDSFDALGLLDEEEGDESQDKVTEIPLKTPEKAVKPKKNKISFWKRIFGNIITDETAELEAKERAAELADEEEKAKLKEEKKQQAEADKAEKAEQAQAEKERKAAAKAEQSAAKAAEKEEKKRLKMEREANEVVGKINPVGATIVMVFFGIICLFVIFGTQMFSYSHAVNTAEDKFKAGDYEDAYQSIAGVSVSESSEEMADKVRICMQLQKKIQSHDNYFKMQLYLEALDCLMKGVRSYDTNKEKADNYGILNQFNALENQIVSLLHSEYGVSETQARSINHSDSQEEYTEKLETIISQWSAKMKEDER